jgi:hypothetical protein
MSDPVEPPKLREHVSELRKALHAIGKDVEIDVADAPHITKEGAKNVMAAAAGVRRRPMKEWTAPSTPAAPLKAD